KSTHAKILAAWMLERQGKLNDKQRLALLRRDPHPRVREHAIRLSEPLLTTNTGMTNYQTLGTVFGPVERLMNDDDSRVRFQLALSIGNKPDAGLLGEIA